MARQTRTLLPNSQLIKHIERYETGNIGKDEMLKILSGEIRKTNNLNAAKLYCDLQGWSKTTVKDIPQISLNFGGEIIQATAKVEET